MLEMQSLISESAAATTSTKKRASDAGLVTKGLVSAAAAEALSKRSRPSASTGSGLVEPEARRLERGGRGLRRPGPRQVGLRQRGDAHQVDGRCSVTIYRPLTPASDPEGGYDYAPGGEEVPEKEIINEVLFASQVRARVARKSRTRKRRTRRAKRKASRRQQAA